MLADRSGLRGCLRVCLSGHAAGPVLFNPLPERAFSEVLERLEKSLLQAPRPVWVVYHNPVLEAALGKSGFLERASRTPQYSVYRTKSSARSSSVR